MDSALRRQTLGDLLRRTRKRFPQKTAIRCGASVRTYAEFDDVCNRLDAGLAAIGVGPGDRVAIIARNSHAFAALRFALARVGGVLVPINFMLNAAEAQFILQHSGAKLLCVDSEFAEIAKVAARETGVERLVCLPSEETTAPAKGRTTYDALLGHGPNPPGREPNSSMPAQTIYTIATGARPKGAVLTHEAVIAEYVTCLVDAEIAGRDG